MKKLVLIAIISFVSVGIYAREITYNLTAPSDTVTLVAEHYNNNYDFRTWEINVGSPVTLTFTYATE